MARGDADMEWVNESEPKEEIENIRYALKRNRPLGEEEWVLKTVKKFGLENTIRSVGRPSKMVPDTIYSPNGVVPTAIFGSATFDVHDINAASTTLANATIKIDSTLACISP